MSQDEDVTIEFKGRHDHITERMQEHATKKLQRLSRFGAALTRVEVVADHAHEHPGSWPQVAENAGKRNRPEQVGQVDRTEPPDPCSLFVSCQVLN